MGRPGAAVAWRDGQETCSCPTDRPPEDRERLRSACQEFEALFLAMLFREMQSTAPGGGALPLGTGGQIYQSLWAQEVSRAAARSSPLGIATTLLDALAAKEGQEAG